MEKILVTKSSMPSFKEYCEEIKELWDTHWLTNDGNKHKQLESELSKYLGIKHCTCFTNGHLALESAINLFNFPRESEIITTPYTFVSTTNAIVRCGMTPVFCDISEEDFCIDVNKIEQFQRRIRNKDIPQFNDGIVVDNELYFSLANCNGIFKCKVP